MDDEQINNLLKPVQGVLDTLKTSNTAREKYGKALDDSVNDVQEALVILEALTKGVAKLQTDVKQAQDSVQAATASGASALSAKVKELQDEFVAEKAKLAKANGEKVGSARKEVIDKFTPILQAIGEQKGNLDGMIDDLNNIGFTSEITKLTQGIKDLNNLFAGKGSGSGSSVKSGSVSERARAIEDSKKSGEGNVDLDQDIHGFTGWHRVKKGDGTFYYFKRDHSGETDGMNLTDSRIPRLLADKETKYVETAKALGGLRGGRRTRKRKRGGFRYGVPKSALPRTLRSILSLKTKSTKRKSPKGRKSRRRRKRRRGKKSKRR